MSLPAPTLRTVQSLDGTLIGYTAHGGPPGPTRPGLVLVQGAMATAASYTSLAALLSPHYTIYTPDRRGRGMSPKVYEAVHDVARDVEDVQAVLRATGAMYVFGMSAGAAVALEAARRLNAIERVALFEPPFYPPYPAVTAASDEQAGDVAEAGTPFSREGVGRLHAAIERGDYPSALLDALFTAQTAPPFLSRIPRPLARLLASAILAVDSRWHRASPASTLRALLPGVRFDFDVAAALDGRMADFATVRQPVLLLSGTRSPTWLGVAIRRLQRVLPDARHVELDGLAHDGPWNGGKPEAVAEALKAFFDTR